MTLRPSIMIDDRQAEHDHRERGKDHAVIWAIIHSMRASFIPEAVEAEQQTIDQA